MLVEALPTRSFENKEAISREALNITQKIADRYESGITVVNLTIQNVQPPEEVQAAFSDAIKAAQDAEKQKTKVRLMPMMLFLEAERRSLPSS